MVKFPEYTDKLLHSFNTAKQLNEKGHSMSLSCVEMHIC